jgi:hypothetical protein
MNGPTHRTRHAPGGRLREAESPGAKKSGLHPAAGSAQAESPGAKKEARSGERATSLPQVKPGIYFIGTASACRDPKTSDRLKR